MDAPTHIQVHRTELCASCKTPCELQDVASFRREAESVCPIGRWQAFKTHQKRSSFSGLGDVVAAVAQPIAGAIDAVAGTKIKGCKGCAKRQQLLNDMFPLGK